MSSVCSENLGILRYSGSSVPFLIQQRQFTLVTFVIEIVLLLLGQQAFRFFSSRNKNVAGLLKIVLCQKTEVEKVHDLLHEI